MVLSSGCGAGLGASYQLCRSWPPCFDMVRGVQEDDVKFAILIYHNPQSREIWDRVTPERRAEGLRAYTGLDKHLAASGEMIVSQALADPSHGKRVSTSGGQVVTSDGPFAEMKEHLAGFYLLDCEGIERAVEVAARIPEAAHGLVEVRPTLSLSDFGDLET
jgi:hypothetical protein